MMENEPGITKGWKYTVRDTKGNETSGVFAGYAMIGPEAALILESDAMTYIPVNKIACMTLLEKGESEQEDRKKEEPGVNYG